MIKLIGILAYQNVWFFVSGWLYNLKFELVWIDQQYIYSSEGTAVKRFFKYFEAELIDL